MRVNGHLCPSRCGTQDNASLHLLPSVLETKHPQSCLRAMWLVLLTLSEILTISACRKDLNGTNAKGREKTLTHVFEEDSLESPYSPLYVSIYESRDIYEINKAFLTGLYRVA